MLRFRLILPDDSEGLQTIREMFEEYQRALGIDLCFQSFQEELDGLPGKYGPPTGTLYLVYDEDGLGACGALRPLEDGACEIKRLYVRPSHRRRGIARSLSLKLLEDAKSLGYSTVKLDTLARLPGAVPLYQSLGFAETHPYNFNPEADIVYMERQI